MRRVSQSVEHELDYQRGVVAPGRLGPRPLMVTVTQTQGRSEPHVDVSLWFVFDGSDCASVTPDEVEFVDTRWWSFDEVRADGTVDFDPHLPRFIGKLRHRLLA